VNEDGISGVLKGLAGEASFTLRLSGEAAEGTFALSGAVGEIKLKRTTLAAPEALGPPPQKLELSQKQWLEDLDALTRILTSEHGAPFHRISAGEFSQAVRHTRRGIPNWTGPRVAAEFRRLSMLIGDGHTGVTLASGQPRYPLRTFWFDDGVRVVETSDDHRNLLGAEVRALGGIPISQVLARLRPFSPLGETEWSYRGDLPALLNRPEILAAAGLPAASRQAWTFRLPTGEMSTVRLEPGPFTRQERAALGDRPPLWEAHTGEPFWSLAWPASDTLYVNFRTYEGLAENAASLGRRLDAERPARLVLDLRDNGGGDYEEGRRLLIPEVVKRPWINREGALYVLVGRNTFSAAMVNAADFRSRTNATLVGEPIGEKPNSWQESRRFYLPNSGLRVGVSTRYYSFAPGGTDMISPQIYAPPRWQDWRDGRDNAMQAIWREVFRHRLTGSRPPSADR